MSDIQFAGNLKPKYLWHEGRDYSGLEVIISCAKHIAVSGIPHQRKPFQMFEKRTKIELTSDGVVVQTEGLKMVIDSSCEEAYTYLKQRSASKDNPMSTQNHHRTSQSSSSSPDKNLDSYHVPPIRTVDSSPFLPKNVPVAKTYSRKTGSASRSSVNHAIGKTDGIFLQNKPSVVSTTSISSFSPLLEEATTKQNSHSSTKTKVVTPSPSVKLPENLFDKSSVMPDHALANSHHKTISTISRAQPIENKFNEAVLSPPIPLADPVNTSKPLTNSFYQFTSGQKRTAEESDITNHSNEPNKLRTDSTRANIVPNGSDDENIDEERFVGPPTENDAQGTHKLSKFFNTVQKAAVHESHLASSKSKQSSTYSYLNSYSGTAAASAASSLSSVSRPIRKPTIYYTGGITNLGNSCYMSAIIQALFSLDELTTDLNATCLQYMIHCQQQSLSPLDTSTTNSLYGSNVYNSSPVISPNVRFYQPLFASRENLAVVEQTKALIQGINANSVLEELHDLIKKKQNMTNEVMCPQPSTTSLPSSAYIHNPGFKLYTSSSMNSSSMTSSKDDTKTLGLRKLKFLLSNIHPDFGTFSQQDAHEYFTTLITRVDEELGTRLFYQYYAYKYCFLKCKKTILSASPIPLPKEEQSNHDSLFTSPVSITGLSSATKTTSNNGGRSSKDQDATNIDEVLTTTSSSSSSSSTTSSVCNTTLSSPTKRQQGKATTTAWEERLSNDEYFITMLKAMTPTTYHLESIMRMQFICKHCGYHYPYKYESYHDFSLDLPTLPNNNPPPPTPAAATSKANSHTIIIDDDDERLMNTAATNNKPSCSMNDLLQRYFAPEERELKCEECLHGNEILLQKQLITVPTVLVLHLKRFQYSYETQSFTKMYQYSIDCPKQLIFPPPPPAPPATSSTSTSTSTNSTVSSSRPVTTTTSKQHSSSLDLGYKYNRLQGSYHALWKEITTTGATRNVLVENGRLFQAVVKVYEEMIQCRKDIEGQLSSSSEEEEESSSSIANAYQLMAIVRHLGTSISQGHYICDVYYPKTEEEIAVVEDTAATTTTTTAGNNKKGQWFRYNDAIVTHIEEEKVMSDMESPYMLFYQRI